MHAMTGLKAGRTRRIRSVATLFAATLILAACGGGGTVQNGGGGSGGGKPNPVQPGPAQKVHLVWKQATNSWKVKFNGNTNEEDPKTAKTKLDPGVGPTMFEVDIQGPGSSTFSFDDSNGLAVWTGSKSTPQTGINSTQILPPMITKQGTLIFWDLNQGDAVTLNYSLHFKNGVPSVDPIVDNGGSS